MNVLVADPKAAADLLTTQLKFAYDLFLAAEAEVRSTERWLLVTLGAMYSYLATKAHAAFPPPLRRVAWYSPAFIVVFAGIRALGLGLRQWQLLEWLKTTEKGGWSQVDRTWTVTATATGFYVVLAVATFVIAYRMTRPSSGEPEDSSSYWIGE